jgi:hypothetical protein
MDVSERRIGRGEKGQGGGGKGEGDLQPREMAAICSDPEETVVVYALVGC